MYLCPQVHFSTLPPKPVIPSKQPFKVDLIGGKRYSWCTCGYSKKQVKNHLRHHLVSLLSEKTHPAYFLITSSSFSRSAMDPTNLKPQASSLYALSQTKTPQFGCVVASTQATLLTAMTRTSWTSSCLLLCTNRPTLEKEGGEVFELKIDVAVASAFLYATVLHTMKAAHVNRSTVTGVLCRALTNTEWP